MWYAEFQVSFIVFFGENKNGNQGGLKWSSRSFCRKSRKSINKYYLGEWVCQISGLFYCFSFDENRYDNQGDMQKLHILSLIAFFVLGSQAFS